MRKLQEKALVLSNYLTAKGNRMRDEQKGGVNLESILVMGLGFVFIGVGFIVFQIFMTAASSLLSWNCTANNTMSYTSFTGFADIVGIMPLVVLVGFMAAGVFAMYLGVRIGTGKAAGKVDLGEIILLALALIFLAIALIILPVTLEAICSTISNNAGLANTGQGISASFVGVADFLRMAPLLLVVSLLGGAVITGFFGMKRMGN